MDCLKCGRETQKNEVFCPDCLTQMAASPVKPDTPVVLPQRIPKDRRTSQKKTVKPEELIVQLQTKVKHLWITVAVLAIALTAAAGSLAVMLYQEWTEPEMGSNYSTFASTEETQQGAN